MSTKSEAGRCDWVDVAKGICIILVVMMHSTLGVEKAIGSETWLHAFIEWARPFRMPDFFLISGLFLAARIDRPWRSYLDTKVVHFAYFYVLWLTIQFVVKAPGMIGEIGAAGTLESYFLSFVDPFGTLWFIYLLAVFFVATKLVHAAPKALVLAGAAALHLLAPKTGWIVADEFSDRFVFFYAGYAFASAIFDYAALASATSKKALIVALGTWAILNALAVHSGQAHVPGPDLMFSFVGIAAVVSFSVLIVNSGAGSALAYCGYHSIAIYLAFTLFMGPTRAVLLKVLGGNGAAFVALAATAAGVLGSLLMRRAVKGTRLAFLFTRPEAMKLPAIEKSLAGAIGRVRAASSRVFERAPQHSKP
jgi:uncharacterized membrane protein YcfT